MASERCKAAKVNGEPCPNPAGADGYCFAHSPNRGAERAEARRRGGRNRHTPHSSAAQPPAAVRTVGDVLQVLDYALGEALAHDNSIARGRLLVAIAAAYVEVFKVGEIEQRLAALEAALNPKATA